MNIFYLDSDITCCARYHCDRHVVKMILESVQILCAVLHKLGQPAPYRATHRNHPCVLWAGQSLNNWLWLKELAYALNEEYQFRFNAIEHRSIDVCTHLISPNLPSQGITERPQTMPEQYKIKDDPILAYRNYYQSEKAHLLKYTKRSMPPWITLNGL